MYGSLVSDKITSSMGQALVFTVHIFLFPLSLSQDSEGGVEGVDEHFFWHDGLLQLFLLLSRTVFNHVARLAQ